MSLLGQLDARQRRERPANLSLGCLVRRAERLRDLTQFHTQF